MNNGTPTKVVYIKSATDGFTTMPLAQLGQHLQMHISAFNVFNYQQTGILLYRKKKFEIL